MRISDMCDDVWQDLINDRLKLRFQSRNRDAHQLSMQYVPRMSVISNSTACQNACRVLDSHLTYTDVWESFKKETKHVMS